MDSEGVTPEPLPPVKVEGEGVTPAETRPPVAIEGGGGDGGDGGDGGGGGDEKDPPPPPPHLPPMVHRSAREGGGGGGGGSAHHKQTVEEKVRTASPPFHATLQHADAFFFGERQTNNVVQVLGCICAQNFCTSVQIWPRCT